MIGQAFVLLSLALTASAPTPLPPIAFLQMGYRQVAPSEPPMIERPASSASVAADCDFNGDGKVDQARLLANDREGRMRAVVVIQTDSVDTYVLDEQPIASLTTYEMRPVRLAGESTCKAVGIGPQRQQTAYRLVGEEFATVDTITSR